MENEWHGAGWHIHGDVCQEMSLPAACLHSQGPHLAVSGGEKRESEKKTGNTAVLWEPRLLLWILKRERGAAIGEPTAHNKHSSFTAHPGHSGKVGRPLNGKGSNKKSKLLWKESCACVRVCLCACLSPCACMWVLVHGCLSEWCSVYL